MHLARNNNIFLKITIDCFGKCDGGHFQIETAEIVWLKSIAVVRMNLLLWFNLVEDNSNKN